MRIAIVSDAWLPQVNGVVRTLSAVRRELEAAGHAVEVFGPDRFRTLPCPTYPEIRLALLPRRRLARLLAAFAPEAIHIATEGPLGSAARSLCRRRGLPFTTSFHTRFPEYLHARLRVPTGWTYAALRRFHSPSSGMLVAARTVRTELERRGFAAIRPWSRGVDGELFRPRQAAEIGDPRPIWLNVGRVAVEKNLEAFLALDLPGTKWVVGDGPLRERLARRHPGARWFGHREGEDLAALYAAADVFVFPSRTDTFGLVLVEALASGLPVAAYPVPGPLDIVTDTRIGVLDADLRRACLAAITCDRGACRRHALSYSWKRCAEQLLAGMVVLPRGGFGGAQSAGSPAASQAA